MKKVIYISLSILLIILFHGCQKEEVDPEPKKLNLTKKSEQLIESDNVFGLNLFKEIMTAEGVDDNVMISPLSVALALGMTYNGSDGTTKEAMEATLKVSGLTEEEINSAYKSIIDQLVKLDPKVIMEIANSIWYRNDVQVYDEFIQTNKDYYYAEVSSLDFSKPDDAKDIINNWVANKTHDLIREIIDYIPIDAVMYLINAMYFKGTWKFEFDKDHTRSEDFFTDHENSIETDMMFMESNLKYMHNDLFEMVELPYGDGGFSMLILLPENGKNTLDVVNELSNDNWNNWVNSLMESRVSIKMPKFKFEYFNLLNDPLCEMGMSVAFNPGAADFSRIAPYSLFISRVLHKTFIDVNEEGTEAAAVTAVEIRFTSISPDMIYFIADRPFLFAIKENSSGSILFMGRVKKPEY